MLVPLCQHPYTTKSRIFDKMVVYVYQKSKSVTDARTILKYSHDVCSAQIMVLSEGKSL